MTQLLGQTDSSILEFHPIPRTPSPFRHSSFRLSLTCRRSAHGTPRTMCTFPSRWRRKEALPGRPLCTSCIWLLLTGMRPWGRNRMRKAGVEKRKLRGSRYRKNKGVEKGATRGASVKSKWGGCQSVGRSSGDTHGGAAASGSCPSMACF